MQVNVQLPMDYNPFKTVNMAEGDIYCETALGPASLSPPGEECSR